MRNVFRDIYLPPWLPFQKKCQKIHETCTILIDNSILRNNRKPLNKKQYSPKDKTSSRETSYIGSIEFQVPLQLEKSYRTYKTLKIRTCFQNSQSDLKLCTCGQHILPKVNSRRRIFHSKRKFFLHLPPPPLWRFESLFNHIGVTPSHSPISCSQVQNYTSEEKKRNSRKK